MRCGIYTQHIKRGIYTWPGLTRSDDICPGGTGVLLSPELQTRAGSIKGTPSARILHEDDFDNDDCGSDSDDNDSNCESERV